MTRIHLLPLCALSLALSACGGGSTGTGSVSSTPPPTTSYQTLDQLTGNQTFQSGGVHWTATPSIGGRGTDAFGSGMAFAYNASTDTFTVTTPTSVTATFDSSTLDPIQSTGTTKVLTKGTDSAQQTLRLFRPTVSGVTLSYTEIASFFNAANSASWVAVGGVPTQASDVPRSGSATYSAETGATVLANGTLYTAGNPSGSSATFSANFANNTVATSVHLVGTPSSGGSTPIGPSGPTSIDFGTVTGTGTISSNGPGFTGTFAGTSGPGFSGAFFGPQAAEAAYAYDYAGSYTGGTYEAFGLTWGKKAP